VALDVQCAQYSHPTFDHFNPFGLF
jgi:hypothetical protein